MDIYTGNKIYDYIREKDLRNYYYSSLNDWALIYGDKNSMPKLMLFLSKVENPESRVDGEERTRLRFVMSISKFLKLPFIFIRYAEENPNVFVWEWDGQEIKNLHPRIEPWSSLTSVFQSYDLLEDGGVNKPVNQYVSNSYHEWQRSNLGNITVSDLDLVKLDGNKIVEIIELKRSKIPLHKWEPYRKDFANFKLIRNTIILSNNIISFKLFYTHFSENEGFDRRENIDNIKVFKFNCDNQLLGNEDCTYCLIGNKNIEEIIN